MNINRDMYWLHVGLPGNKDQHADVTTLSIAKILQSEPCVDSDILRRIKLYKSAVCV